MFPIRDENPTVNLPIATLARDVTTFTDTNATCYELNCYRIRAIDASG